MRQRQTLLRFLALVALAVRGSPAPSMTYSAPAPAFTYDRESFLLGGEPFVMVGGQMDPQRIPRAYWGHRLARARAMGLNTVFVYVFWNLFEPAADRRWVGGDAQPSNDVAAFLRLAQHHGLRVVLRPGPYACGEREWGGFPYWLAKIDGMRVRSSEGPFSELARGYLERLAGEVRDLQVTRGGPLLMVQVENEYGSYGEDHAYTEALRDILRELFEVPLYTNDGGVDWTLKGGSVPGVLAEIDGDPRSGFAARDQYVTDASQLGPLLDGEYYTYGPDTWGSTSEHSTTAGDPERVAALVADVEYVLAANNSISLYMFHGGTNFGFSNGALWQNRTAAFVSSYDYGAPLDESGRTTDLYFALRDAIVKYAAPGSVPEPPPDVPLFAMPNVTLKAATALFDTLGDTTTRSINAGEPLPTMEDLDQAYGLVLYEHVATAAVRGVLRAGDRPRDRIIAYVNGVRVGVLDSTYETPANVTLALAPGDVLRLLVENLGRVDYWSRESGTFVALEDPSKGIVGDVVVGNAVLEGWTAWSLPLDEPPAAPAPAVSGSPDKVPVPAGSPPVFYYGTFRVDGGNGTVDPMALDTFLGIPDGVKGNVWVNDFNLGRYWLVGPQQSLYLPGALLRTADENRIVVLELEPKSSQDALASTTRAERVWANYPDTNYA
ncbi:glycoside hydrolase family 35 protein [Hypoxylon sp. FL1284]|nr:glycoside hydrolase family 35 protein [Hypoxylon sp. FL1284]